MASKPINMKSNLLMAIKPLDDLTLTSITQPGAFFHMVKEHEVWSRLQSVAKEQLIGIDTETTGLDPHQDSLRLVQISSVNFPVLVFDLYHLPEEGLVLLNDILASSALKIMQGGKFDLMFLEQNGFKVEGPYFDTMLASRLINGCNQEFSYNLSALCERFLGYPLEKNLQQSNWHSELQKEQIAYSALDAFVLIPLYKVLKNKINNLGLETAAFTEFSMIRSLAKMELEGLVLDTAKERKIYPSYLQLGATNGAFRIKFPGKMTSLEKLLLAPSSGKYVLYSLEINNLPLTLATHFCQDPTLLSLECLTNLATASFISTLLAMAPLGFENWLQCCVAKEKNQPKTISGRYLHLREPVSHESFLTAKIRGSVIDIIKFMIHYLRNIYELRVAATDNQRILFYQEKSLSDKDLVDELQNIQPFGLELPLDLSLTPYRANH